MNARGFTLLEVLVALVILGTAVVASIQGFAQGLRLLKLSGDHQEAMLFADTKLRDIVAPEAGREEGAEGRFSWTRTVTRVPTPELGEAARPSPWAVYQIDVRVRWDERREVELTTLRTTSIADAQPGTAAHTGQPGQAGSTATPAQTGTPTGTSPPALPRGPTGRLPAAPTR